MARSRSYGPSKVSEETRFKFYTKKTKTCWWWTGPHTAHGRPTIRLSKNPEGENYNTYYAHRWSYEKFVGPIPDGLYVCHKCDNPSCVRPDHLFVGTQDDNMKDMVRKGRQNNPLGESNGRAKLTEDDVRYIRLNYKKMDKVHGARAMGRRYGVVPATITEVVARRKWTHVV